MTYFSGQDEHASKTLEQLDRIPMSDRDRSRARAALEQGERFAEFVLARMDEIQRLTEAVRHVGVRLTAAVRVRLKKAHRERMAARRRRARARAA